jgi:hypothetical protein
MSKDEPVNWRWCPRGYDGKISSILVDAERNLSYEICSVGRQVGTCPANKCKYNFDKWFDEEIAKEKEILSSLDLIFKLSY